MICCYLFVTFFGILGKELMRIPTYYHEKEILDQCQGDWPHCAINVNASVNTSDALLETAAPSLLPTAGTDLGDNITQAIRDVANDFVATVEDAFNGRNKSKLPSLERIEGRMPFAARMLCSIAGGPI